jgi:hypothetical protein
MRSNGEEAGASDRDHYERLREGTMIPPTAGRVVMLGRRWAFVPANQESAKPHDLVDLEAPFRTSTVSFHSKPRPTRLGAAATTIFGSSDSSGATLIRNDGAVENDSASDLPHLILVENLMLERIVEAIRADASDDRWLLSGEVTEFFTENRLLIRTAQRANSN